MAQTNRPQKNRKPRCQNCTTLRKEVKRLKAEIVSLDKENDTLYDIVNSGAEFLKGIVAFIEKEDTE